MPRFHFEAVDASGAAVSGMEFALDEVDLDRRLASSELLLVRAEKGKTGKNTSTQRSLVDFCYHMAIVMDAGIPLIEGLRDLANGDHPMHEVIADIMHKVESGASLSAAMSEHPKHFPELIRGLVRAGEESGSLDRVLMDLVSYLEWREDLRRQISSAATYPVLIVIGIVGLMILLGAFVLPRFLQIFTELGGELPLGTRALLFVHSTLSTWWPVMLGLVAAAAASAWWLLRKPAVRLWLDGVILRLPLLGNLTLMIEMSRFSHNLGLLQSSGMPMLRSLRVVEDVVQNRVLRETIRNGRERVEQGATLTDSLGRSDVFPSLVMRMLSVGEVSGRIAESLERVSSYYDREVPAVVERALALFNTGMLLVLAATLLTVALSIFAPMYQMMGELGGG